jgi:hypothetical protein
MVVDVLHFKVERSFTLAYGDSTGDFDDVVVECLAHVVEIGEDESFAHVESYCDYILCVFTGEAFYIVDGQGRAEQEFLIVSQLNDEGDVKDIL